MFALSGSRTEAGIAARRKAAQAACGVEAATEPKPVQTQPVSLPVVRERLRPAPRLVPAHIRIIREVAAAHRVSVKMILSHDRHRPAVAARREAIARVYQEVKVDGKPPSLLRLGRWFDKDHTSILHALTKAGLKPPKGQRV
jgi:chromosomal replication initiation ATPase DnaA